MQTKDTDLIFLVDQSLREKIELLVSAVSWQDINFLCSNAMLNDLICSENSLLISFGTSCIVTKGNLDKFAKCYNIHGASSMYPGRDPHHWAIYDQASYYGATLHIMAERVDEGSIIKTSGFMVEPGDTPTSLLSKANRHGLGLLEWLVDYLVQKASYPDPSGELWGGVKKSRRDFKMVTEIKLDDCQQSYEKKKRAFCSNQYNNLWINLHGDKYALVEEE